MKWYTHLQIETISNKIKNAPRWGVSGLEEKYHNDFP